MILKTILFFLVLYLLIKVVSALFLPAANKRNSNVRFFYRTFKDVRQQQEKSRRSSNPKERLNEIEEAEYEDVTEQDADSGDKKEKEK